MAEWREIAVSTEHEAEAEAHRQQEAEADPEAEWIYLRNSDGVWVARRVPPNWKPPSISKKEAMLEQLNPFDPNLWT